MHMCLVMQLQQWAEPQAMLTEPREVKAPKSGRGRVRAEPRARCA